MDQISKKKKKPQRERKMRKWNHHLPKRTFTKKITRDRHQLKLKNTTGIVNKVTLKT